MNFVRSNNLNLKENLSLWQRFSSDFRSKICSLYLQTSINLILHIYRITYASWDILAEMSGT